MTNHPTSHADLPSLLELAEVVATCIPFLPPAGQKNIGRVVEQMILIGNTPNMTSYDEVLPAIIAALTPPEGYVLVPVEPTEAMKSAFTGFRPVQRTSFACRYEEMLAARPEEK